MKNNFLLWDFVLGMDIVFVDHTTYFIEPKVIEIWEKVLMLINHEDYVQNQLPIETLDIIKKSCIFKRNMIKELMKEAKK